MSQLQYSLLKTENDVKETMEYLRSPIIKAVKCATPATVSLFLFHYLEFIIKQIAEKKKLRRI